MSWIFSCLNHKPALEPKVVHGKMECDGWFKQTSHGSSSLEAHGLRGERWIPQIITERLGGGEKGELRS